MRKLAPFLVLVATAGSASAEHLPVVADAYTTIGAARPTAGPSRNFGGQGTILVGSGFVLPAEGPVGADGSDGANGVDGESSSLAAYDCHGFVRFDLSQLPLTTAIAKAVVRMWVGSAPLPGSMGLHLVLEPWAEDTISGQAEPAVGPMFASVPIATAGQFVFVDVTLQARQWLAGTVPNHGLALLPIGTDSLRVGLDAKENTGTGHEMELEVFELSSARFTLTESSNTALGVHSLISLTTGVSNTALGAGALLSNTEGNSNTAIGYQALLANTIGNSNVAVGISALQANSSGSFNTATGRNVLIANTTGHSNSAHGFNSLKSNTIGHANVANGVSALESNVDGIFNTASGVNSLYANTHGSHNSAFGSSSLFSNLGGDNNTSMGVLSLASNTTGGNNVALGHLAGTNLHASLTANDHSVFIGAHANSSVDGLTNAIAIGAGAQVSLSNVAVIGNANLLGVATAAGLYATGSAAPTIASATTIAPTRGITFVSGTSTIQTITAPSPISAGGGQITLIPTGAWATGTSGNIAVATTAVINRALILVYDAATGKWYPSY